MKSNDPYVCPAEAAGALDIRIRKWFHDPRRILGPYISPGMRVLDFGCGPGFFTVDIARMVGDGGRVVAADLQQGMLDRVKAKIEGTPLSGIVRLHRCGAEELGIGADERFDLILAFWMLHEVPDQEATLRRLAALLAPGGRILVIEPKGHVTGKAFAATEKLAVEVGFRVMERPKVCFSRSMLLGLE